MPTDRLGCSSYAPGRRWVAFAALLLIRCGGAIPLVSALAARGVPTILTGFALNESNAHSPNEGIPADYLRRGIDAAAALYRHLARLG